MIIMKSLALLGFPVEEKVTKLKGVVISISFDIPGCVMALVSPPIVEDEEGKSYWFDVNRVKIDGPAVMPNPGYKLPFIKEKLDMLGYVFKDKITQLMGAMNTMTFDLDGTINGALAPQMNAKGKLPTAHVLHVDRLEKQPGERLMEPIDFDRTAAAILAAEPVTPATAPAKIATEPRQYAHGGIDKSSMTKI